MKRSKRDGHLDDPVARDGESISVPAMICDASWTAIAAAIGLRL
jgi:hypothetical protein